MYRLRPVRYHSVSVVVAASETQGRGMSISVNSARMALDPEELLTVAIAEAELGKREGGIPIGAALFGGDGNLLGSGRNRRVQHADPSVHGETDAFRAAGRSATTARRSW